MGEWIWWLVIGQSTAPATKAVGVMAYAVTTALCLWAMRDGKGREKTIWGMLAGMQFLMLGDVRWDWGFSLATIAREAALAEHWYQQRGAILPWMVLGITGFLLGGLATAIGLSRPVKWPAVAALLGTTASALVHGVQAISWHMTDMLLYRMVGPVMVVAWLWLTGAACTSVGAVGFRYAATRRSGDGVEIVEK